MRTIAAMEPRPAGKYLTHEHKITARTAAEVVEGVDLLLVRLKRHRVRFLGRRIGAEGLIGAVLLELLALPEDRQRDLLARRLPELEALLGYKAAAAAPAEADASPPRAPSGEPYAVRDARAPKPPGRRKGQG